jgi:hypothetical protein
MNEFDKEMSKFRDDFDRLDNGSPSHSQDLINMTTQIWKEAGKNRFDTCIAIINRLAKEVDYLHKELQAKTT